MYELVVNGKQVMRRRSDNWINATHILIVAELDKPARTRVLEKEVQLGTHEKIQGGYGKYQGTWVPLEQGLVVAQKYNVYNILRPIFDFTAGPESPPKAPKRTNAAAKPRQAKATTGGRKAQPKQQAAPRRAQKVEIYDNISEQLHDDDSPDENTIDSPSMIDEDDYPGTGNRRRHMVLDEQAIQSREHQEWSDRLLDYFMLLDDNPTSAVHNRPRMPPNVQIDRPVDTDGHTALHWACSMGDVETAKELLQHHASVYVQNVRGETPLVRAGLFANCFDHGTWAKMVHLLQDTIMTMDFHGGTVFHHIALTASGGSKVARAKHYLDILLNKLMEMVAPTEFVNFLNMQDKNGDTAFHIAARLSRRCSKLFTAYGVPSDIPNGNGETVSSIMGLKTTGRPQSLGGHLIASSSPVTERTHLVDTSPSKFSTTLGVNMHHLKTVPSQTFSRNLNSLIAGQFNSFLEAGETEMAEKEALLADVARAAERINKEASGIRQKIYALTATLESSEEDFILQQECDNLIREAERLEEQVQHRQLQRLVHQEENGPEALNGSSSDNHEIELKDKEMACRTLAAEQETRRRFVKELVLAESNSGMTNGGQHLMAMVSKILGISTDQVAGVIDEILEDMKASKGPDVLSDGAVDVDL